MNLSIQAQPREVFGKANRRLRISGLLPAVLYGMGKDTVALSVDKKDFEKVYKQAGENTLVDLAVEGQNSKKVLIHDVAMHFMKNEPVHIDFYEVDLTRKIHAEIPLEFTGISAAVKELSGILVKNMSEVEVESLPADLPHSIEVNLDKLKTFEDVIEIKDLNLPENVKLVGHNPDDVVALVQEPRSEAELEELDKSTEEAEKAAIEGLAAEEKKEGEEGEDQTAESGGRASTPPDKKPAGKEEKSEEKPEKK